MNKQVRKGLGKGLSALLPEYGEGDETNSNNISINKIHPNPLQPRKHFDEEKIIELSESIKIHGVLQPVIVREVINGYELIAGERRWRAAKVAGLEEIPAIIKSLTDNEVIEIGLIENLQREDLNPVEEAMAYKILMEEHQLTQEILSQRVGKSRAHIANTVRLLNLSRGVIRMIETGTITPGLARPLLALESSQQEITAEMVVGQGLNAREVEEMVRRMMDGKGGKKPSSAGTAKTSIPQPVKEMEEVLKIHLGTQVKIKHTGNKGKIEIEYYSDGDLDRIYELMLYRAQ